MKRELLSKVFGDIDDQYIAEAYHPAQPAASGSERMIHMKKKKFITLGLVAALLLTLSVAAYAINQAVGTPQAAQRVALQEIERWKQIGLLNPEVQFEGDPNMIVEIKEHKGSESWYGRFFAHSYDVRFYLGPVSWGNQTPSADLVQRKYGCNLTIDTLSGKITRLTRRENGWKSPSISTITMQTSSPRI